MGVGATVQVNRELATVIRREGRLASALNLVAFLAGIAPVCATDLLVAL